MPYEIERKFLVKGKFNADVFFQSTIKQGYLSSNPKRIVRIRTINDKAFLTIKSTLPHCEFMRYEWEKEIDFADALDMLAFCESSIIDKTRYLAKIGNHTFEIDEFHGDNEGLLFAEIELNSESEDFDKPLWLGKEVTNDIRYYNFYIAKHPYKLWKK